MPPTPTVKYQKLPGTGLTGSRLYLGPDHLLQVTSNGFTESYQRFYLQDIQSIVYHHTLVGRFLNGALGGLALFFLLLAAGINEDAGWIGFGIIVGFFLGLLLVNVVLGPTCACYITTAVQTRKLSSLSRVKRARAVIARLRPLIAAAQGELPSETSSREFNPPSPSTSAPDVSPTSAAGNAPAGPEAPPVIDPPA